MKQPSEKIDVSHSIEQGPIQNPDDTSPKIPNSTHADD